MPAGKWEQLLYKIRTLRTGELRAIRRWNEWCDIDSLSDSGGRANYTSSLRDSAETYTENGLFTYEEFEKYLRTVSESVHQKPITQLRESVQNPTITKVSTNNSVKQELWVSAQLYGYLQREFIHEDAGEFQDDLMIPKYRVYREHGLYGYNLDLLVEDETRERKYLIETKYASTLHSQKDQTTIDQIQRYNKILENREYTLVPIYYEYAREIEGNDSNATNLKELKDKIEKGCSDTECIFCKLGPV